MPRLLLIAHAPSDNTRRLTEAALAGANHPDIDVEVIYKPPLEANADDVLAADAILLGTTENFGYMSGAMKDFFDRIYYPCLEHTEGLPYALFVRAGNDGTGAKGSIERIIIGLKWRAIQPALVMAGPFQQDFISQCEELGMTLAAGLEAGIY
ncbi:MAG: NAD(P)H-dependent oxidoreductase [Halopseudomonas sp.]